MHTMDQMVNNYTSLLQTGELQSAYRGILEFMSKLRSDLGSRNPSLDMGGSLYQGYMDMSYFSLGTQALKKRDLKIAVVYLHEQKSFEAWLSARNRKIVGRYRAIFRDMILDDVDVFHDEENEDSVIECLLTSSPDFDNQSSLMDMIERETLKFVGAMQKVLEKIPKNQP
jgi:hypothetical protein